MNDTRIHAVLDGELPREALTAPERERLAALEACLAEATSVLRSAPVPDFRERVLAALPARPEPAPSTPAAAARFAAWLWRPITVQLRPAFALGGLAAAALGGVLVLPQLEDDPAALPIAATSADETRLYVQFRLEAPGASAVAVAGSFTEWQPEHDLREVAPGVWSALVPLEPGVHDYTFVIDGRRMVVDPYAPRVDDDFGGSNSRLFLPAPNGSA